MSACLHCPTAYLDASIRCIPPWLQRRPLKAGVTAASPVKGRHRALVLALTVCGKASEEDGQIITANVRRMLGMHRRTHSDASLECQQACSDACVPVSQTSLCGLPARLLARPLACLQDMRAGMVKDWGSVAATWDYCSGGKLQLDRADSVFLDGAPARLPAAAACLPAATTRLARAAAPRCTTWGDAAADLLPLPGHQ